MDFIALKEILLNTVTVSFCMLQFHLYSKAFFKAKKFILELSYGFSLFLGETGHCFLSTKPVILLCNLKLKKGQTKIGK